jgi:hypothetical protein
MAKIGLIFAVRLIQALMEDFYLLLWFRGTSDRCYDFFKYFRQKNQQKIGIF